MEFNIPFNWKPRAYQESLWRKLEAGCKRVVYVWHRRAGKDLFGLNWLLREAFRRKGVYWHVFPEFSQGRRAIWDAITVDGKKYLDFIPRPLIKSTSNQEMKIELINGSIYQIIGSDRLDKIVGAGPAGVLFSEYSIAKPNSWDFIQPMIEATDGFAMFNFTPRGENHAYDLYNMAKSNPKWHAEILSVGDTKVFTPDKMEEIKAEYLGRGKTLASFNQEYYCSFMGAIEGAYYAEKLEHAEKQGRIASFSYDSRYQVETWWDLGMSDATSIWFTQTIGNRIYLIDYLENNNRSLEDYVNELNKKNYIYKRDNLPHDVVVREMGTGKSRLEILESLGRNVNVVAKIPVQDGINAVRSILDRCYFDKENCREGIRALKHYHAKKDEDKNTFQLKPYHDWASHGADAFRYFAVGHQDDYSLQANNMQLHY
jgi:hypothetical protein